MAISSLPHQCMNRNIFKRAGDHLNDIDCMGTLLSSKQINNETKF